MKTTTRIIAGLAMVTAIIGGGTASAAYAWYQLNQDKVINLSGTSLGKSADLKIGFVSDTALSYEGLSYSDTDSTASGKPIYWSENKTVPSDMVKYVLQTTGYSYSDLYPITSGAYNKGDVFNLYDAPYPYGTFKNSHDLAAKNLRIHLSLAFKVLGGSGATSEAGASDRGVYLSAFQLAGSAKNSVRLHLSSTNLSTIVNPMASAQGNTLVGGPLDLNQDGIFDYAKAEDGNYYEVCYGQYTGWETDNSALIYGAPYSATVHSTDRNYDCFVNPNHDKGVYPLSQVSSYASTAYYENMASYLYESDMGDYTSLTPLCITDANGLGFLDIDIYMEGWDLSLINNVIGSSIGTSFSFAPGEDEVK